VGDVRVEIVNSVNDVNIEEQVVTIVLGNSGPQGPQGVRGNAILNGEGPPDNSLGIIGDFYIDTLTQEMYGPKNNTDWGTNISLIPGYEELGYVHVQTTPSDEWTIFHGLGFIPNMTVVDDNGIVIEGSYYYPDANTVVATFTESISGKAYFS
jgi:hypothetical protein